jgi:putative ABC transport system permease protein
MAKPTPFGNVPLARRQLLARRGRAVAGVIGIAVALLLILALKAIFAGMEERLTAYIDRSGADVIVAQQGVETMHMTESALPTSVVSGIRQVPGVAAARPILYVPATVERGDRQGIVYLIGDDAGGAPFPVRDGRRPQRGEILLDRVLAERLRVSPGETVRVLGATFRVSGEVSGLALITNSFAFARRQDVARLLKGPDVVNYVLVQGDGGIDDTKLASRIEASVSGVTATPRAAFASSERHVVGDMSTDIVRGMMFVGFVIGVAVAGLVAYSQTLTQLRDYGVLRALGSSARRAVAVVLGQIGAIVAVGFVVAFGLVWLLALVLPTLSPTLVLAIRTGDIVQASAVAGAVAVGAALAPVARVVRVEPASVFRRAS